MTREEVQAYAGRRARIRRADGAVLVGKIRVNDSVRVGVVGAEVARWIRYDQIVSIEPAADDVPNTH